MQTPTRLLSGRPWFRPWLIGSWLIRQWLGGPWSRRAAVTATLVALVGLPQSLAQTARQS
jgi:hypothetical protein